MLSEQRTDYYEIYDHLFVNKRGYFVVDYDPNNPSFEKCTLVTSNFDRYSK